MSKLKKMIANVICKDEIENLEKENKSLKKKLDEKQEVINQTNAYWKKKMYNLKKKKEL